MRFPQLIVVAVLLSLGACESVQEPLAVESPVTAQATTVQVQLSALQSGPAGYIAFTGGGKLPKNLEAQVTAAGGTITGRADAVGMAFVSSDNPDFPGALKGLQVIPDVLLQSAPATETAFARSTPSGAGDDEPFFWLQWGMRAIDAPQAWDHGVRGEGALVAVLDEGFDLDHPDLSYARGAMSFACWQAPNWSVEFAAPPFCESPEYGAGFDFGPGAYPPLFDVFSHATHVSGIIAALDNGVGVIGVAPDARILPVKVLSEYLGGGYTSWILQGILYAVARDANVINMSLSGMVDMRSVPPGERDDVMRASIVLYRRIINYAYQQGTTVVVSAGNDGIDADGDGRLWIRPAEFERAITVSATAPYGLAVDPNTDLDRPASYNNTGNSLVDFAAPGGDSMFPGPYIYDMVISTGSADWYYWSAGTSMAAPHVAGAAALIIGKNGGSMHPAQVERELRRGAVDLGKRGRDPIFGQGRITAGY